MKKLFSGIKGKLSNINKQKTIRFTKKYGPIIAIGLCVGIVSLVYGVSWNGDGDMSLLPDATGDNPQNIVIDDGTALPHSIIMTTNDSKYPNITPNLNTPIPLPKQTPIGEGVIKTISAIPRLSRPVEGDIIANYARDVLIYSDTLKQWSTHLAVDFSAKEGSMVTPVLAGTITKVYEDALLGTCIEIKHSERLTGIYCSLKTAVVSVGDEVKIVDTIGQAGIAISEINLGPHIHFVLMLDDREVNSAPFFKD